MEQESKLEELVNYCGIRPTLNMLADICNKKANHIRTTYGNMDIVEIWERNAELINNILSELE